MLSERDIGEALGRTNPIPDPEHAASDAEADALFAAISRRRKAMVLTDHSVQEEKTAEPPRWRLRRRAVLVAAALVVLIAVPAVAMLIDWDRPPLGKEFPGGTALVTNYGPLGDDCAWIMAFDPSGAPLVAGSCGVLRLEGDGFAVITPELGSYMDMAVATDGTVWLADVDGPVKSITNGLVTEHSLVARQIEVTSDGSVYAIRYGPTDVPSLMKYEEGIFVEALPGPFDDIAAAPDGSLHTISAWDFGAQSGVEAPAQQTLGRVADGRYTTEPIPDGFAGEEFTVAPDGALWVIGDTGEIVDRGGESDVEWALIRYDGSEVSSLIAPFPEPNDLAVHPDGTVWVTSVYGAFAYDGDQWVQYGVDAGLPDEDAACVEIGPDRSVYIGTNLGVTRIAAESD